MRLLLITWEASFAFDIGTPKSSASDPGERKRLRAYVTCRPWCKWKHRPSSQKDWAFQDVDRALNLVWMEMAWAQGAGFQHGSRLKQLNFPQHHCLTHVWGRGERGAVLGLVSRQLSNIKPSFRNYTLIPSSSRCPLVTFLVTPTWWLHLKFHLSLYP